MKVIRNEPTLNERVYRAILDEICAGSLPAGAHLVQEQLAEQLGVSRQPVQQAMALLKAGGIVEEVGRRGLRVVELDLDEMQHRYDIRAALDELAASGAALRAKADKTFAAELKQRGREILSDGQSAVKEAAVTDQIRHDEAFHILIYKASGNPLLARTAEPHWRFLRRVMGEVLRQVEPAPVVWHQHREIPDCVIAGDSDLAGECAARHVQFATDTSRKSLGTSDPSGKVAV